MKIIWAKSFPSAQETFPHRAQVVKKNGNKGSLNFSESGVEANYKINRARTTMFRYSADCRSHFWGKSDIKVVKIANRLLCTPILFYIIT